jgi:hypothetical protein
VRQWRILSNNPANFPKLHIIIVPPMAESHFIFQGLQRSSKLYTNFLNTYSCMFGTEPVPGCFKQADLVRQWHCQPTHNSQQQMPAAQRVFAAVSLLSGQYPVAILPGGTSSKPCQGSLSASCCYCTLSN